MTPPAPAPAPAEPLWLQQQPSLFSDRSITWWWFRSTKSEGAGTILPVWCVRQGSKVQLPLLSVLWGDTSGGRPLEANYGKGKGNGSSAWYDWRLESECQPCEGKRMVVVRRTIAFAQTDKQSSSLCRLNGTRHNGHNWCCTQGMDTYVGSFAHRHFHKKYFNFVGPLKLHNFCW